MKSDFAKAKLFAELASEARACLICKAMQDKTAVLSELNGNLDPKVLFIAEAPGRQGADRTRKPFSGDKSGANFQVLLDSIDLKREEIFITNAVLCSPRKESGANRKPTKNEIKNCSNYLKGIINLINPNLIATLGSVALEALKTIENHQFTLKTYAGSLHKWNRRLLIPLYHPSPQVVITVRKMPQQLADFQTLKKAILLKEV
ncbi:uracil-DNA glycosylase [soil metagenome]